MHPAKDGFAALPFFDEFDLSTVDVLLLSQYVVTPLSSRSDRICQVEKRMSKRVGFVAATSVAVNDSEGIPPPTSNTQTWFMYIRKSMQIFAPFQFLNRVQIVFHHHRSWWHPSVLLPVLYIF
jgi:hypothetical protein